MSTHDGRNSTSLAEGGDESNAAETSTQLQQDYQSLEERVWALGKTEYQIVDSDIVKCFRQVRDGIDIWIDDNLDEKERHSFGETYQRNLTSPAGEKMFSELGFEAGSMIQEWGKELGRLETCIFVILGMVISKHLRRIFTKKYPFGMTEVQMDFIGSMETVLHPQGPSDIFVSELFNTAKFKNM